MSLKYILFIVGMTCVTTTALARDSNFSGFYITGKVGASVLQEKKQKYTENYGKAFSYSQNTGGTHTNAHLGGGVAVGYNFYKKFNIPVRAEFDFTARTGDNAHFIRDSRGGVSPNFLLIDYQDRINNKIELNTYMFNAYYDFKNSTKFTPYISGGLGLAPIHHRSIRSQSMSVINLFNWKETHSNTLSSNAHTSYNFAWSAGAGVQYQLSKHFSFDFNYRYVGAGTSTLTMYREEKYSEKSRAKIVTQDVMLGLTYNF